MSCWFFLIEQQTFFVTLRLNVDPFCLQILSLQGPETSTCVQLPLGVHYTAKVRARPDGLTYSGDWSGWSDAITGETPADKSELILNCCDVQIANVIFTWLFSENLQAHFSCCVSPSVCSLLPSLLSPCFPSPSGRNQVILRITQSRP